MISVSLVITMGCKLPMMIVDDWLFSTMSHDWTIGFTRRMVMLKMLLADSSTACRTRWLRAIMTTAPRESNEWAPSDHGHPRPLNNTHTL